MNKIAVAFLGCCLLFLENLSGAGENGKTKPLSFFFNGGVQQYSYKEFAPQEEGGGKLMEISGMFWGVNAGASLQHEWVEQMIKVGYFQSLNTKYDGRIQNGDPYSGPSKDYYLLSEYHILPYVFKSDVFVLKADLGLGYRFLHNLVQDAYRRSQHYAYFVAGLNGEKLLSKYLAVFTKLHYVGLIKGWHKTFLTDIGFDRDLNLTQEFGHGYRIELGLKRFLAHSMTLELSLYYEFWNIGDSNFAYATKGNTPNRFYEPYNHTNVYGVQLGMKF